MIDKALNNGNGYELDESGNLKTVSGLRCNLQAAYVRILSEKGSWLYDEEFGSVLQNMIRDLGVRNITQDDLFSAIGEAISPLIQDGRIQELKDLEITGTGPDFIEVKMRIILDNTVIVSNYIITE